MKFVTRYGTVRDELVKHSVGSWLGGEMIYVKGMALEAVEGCQKQIEKSSARRAA